MRALIEEFQADVFSGVSDQAVVAEAKGVLRAKAVGVPGIDTDHGAGIGRDKIRERKDAMAIFAAARGESGNQGMIQPGEKSFALTTVVERVFTEGCRQTVTSGSANGQNAEVGAETLAISFRALSPFWGSVVGLVDAGSDGSADDGVRTEGIEKIVGKLGFRRRRRVGESGLGISW